MDTSWRIFFDERQQKEIEFSELYASKFCHGTDGHNAKLIIAHLAMLLDQHYTSGKPIVITPPRKVESIGNVGI